MKNRSLLKRKLKLFYKNLEPKRKNLDNSLRIQTCQECSQNEIKKTNKKAFAAEQRFRGFKKILFRTKAFQKRKCKRLQPNKLIQKATNNLCNIKSTPKPSKSKSILHLKR